MGWGAKPLVGSLRQMWALSAPMTRLQNPRQGDLAQSFIRSFQSDFLSNCAMSPGQAMSTHLSKTNKISGSRRDKMQHRERGNGVKMGRRAWRTGGSARIS